MRIDYKDYMNLQKELEVLKVAWGSAFKDFRT
jgi:hypothetical protein